VIKVRELSEYWKDYKAYTKDMRAKSKKENMRIIVASGLPFRIMNQMYDCIRFDIDGKPVVDFYPGTGRWQIIKEHRVLHGGAESFVNWFKKQ